MLTVSQAKGNSRGGQGKAEHQGRLLPHGPLGQGHAQQEHGQGNAPDQGLGTVAAGERNADLRIGAQAAEGHELPSSIPACSTSIFRLRKPRSLPF